MMWTDDPVRDAERHAVEQDEVWEKMMSHQPVCEICGEHIAPDDYYFEDGGAFYHLDCIYSQRKIMYEVTA